MDNRREQFRIAPQTEKDQKVRLLAGRKKIACELVNESAGGFMISTKKKVKLSTDMDYELQLFNRSAPVKVLWSRREADDQFVHGLERQPEHQRSPSLEKRGGLLLVALVIAASFLAGYMVKNDPGVKQLLLKHGIGATSTAR